MQGSENNFSDWKVGDKYEIVKEIGVGSYGSVVQAKVKASGEKVAIKRIGQIFEDLIDGKRILREIAILRRLHNPYIVNIVEIIKPENYKSFNEIYVVLEYAQSDLKKLLKSPYHLEMNHINTLAYGILVGTLAVTRLEIHPLCWHSASGPETCKRVDQPRLLS
jgi:mitogen-activated protein kinase 1/3